MPIWPRAARSELTVTGLEKDKAKALSTEELKQLLVGKTVRIKNLATGEEYAAAYGEDGMRTLAATVAFASARARGGEEPVCDQGRQTLDPVG